MNEEIAQVESDLELGQSLARLKNNRDFKKLILKMYLEDGAIMLTKNLKKIKYNSNAKMDIINDEYIARSSLYGFMDDIEANALSGAEYMKELAEEGETDGSRE